MKILQAILLMLWCSTSGSLCGQTGDTYFNLQAVSGLVSVRGDSVIETENKNVRFVLDETINSLTVRWDWSEFHVTDSLFSAGLRSIPEEFVFVGKFDLEFLNTDSDQGTLQYEIPGEVSISGQTDEALIDAEIDHVGLSEDLSCRLWLTFDINIRKWGLAELFPGHYEFIHVESILLIPEKPGKY